jgi:hypothetical protein
MVAVSRIAGALGRLAASRAGRRAAGASAFAEAEGEQAQSLNSSAIARAGYSMNDQTLTITFARGRRTYTYYGVPPGVYLALVNAPSAGRYFVYNIRNNYQFS